MHSNRSTFGLNVSAALLVGVLSLSLATAFAQDTTAPSAQTPTTADIVVTDRRNNTTAQNTTEAWDMLTTAAQDSKHAELRIQALAALGTIGNNARSEAFIVEAMKDPDLDVRTAAVLAAGETKDRNLATNLRTMLNDKEPQVAFAAATTLWKMKDPSGEDILLAVVNGERKPTAGLKNSTMHTVGKDLHNPATLARIGALQGATMLLGPFGFGITAYEYMRKNGGDSARVTAIEQISQEKTGPVRTTLIAALGDKDTAVRAAAAKALGSYREKPVSDALLAVFDDTKPPVRLTAAAAYILSSSTSAVRKKTVTNRSHA
jgi:HEAT repeat protein